MIALTPLPAAKASAFRARSIRPDCDELTEAQVHELTGNRIISAWRTAPNTIRIQVRCPQLARRISKLEGVRRVDRGGFGPFFRLYEVPHDFAWAKEYVTSILSELN